MTSSDAYVDPFTALAILDEIEEQDEREEWGRRQAEEAWDPRMDPGMPGVLG